MNRKSNYFKLLTVLIFAALLTSCSVKSAYDTNAANKPAVTAGVSDGDGKITSTVTADMVTYDKDDYYTDWKSENPNYIELNGSKAGLKGSGAVLDGNKITINKAGVYAISGKLDNGQIIVDTKDKGTVRLVLNVMEINCSNSSPIYVKNAEKTVITLADGTQNTVTDGENYVFTDSGADEPNAAIFSKDNLTINGTGTLTVRGNYRDGIASKDSFRITGGSINVYSVDDGLKGKDMLIVKEGNITVEAGGDGIKATNDTDTSKGFVALEGGRFKITSGTDAIQAKTTILVMGGEFNISSGGGSANSSDKKADGPGAPWGKWEDNTAAQDEETESQSAKAIKSSGDISITGGTINIDSSDDAIHCNNSAAITGGDISIASGDDGIHADSSITIKNGKINISKSYEGIESAHISVSGGEIHVVSKDDGVNVAGGNDSSSVQGRPGQNNFSSTGDYTLDISSGYISVNAAGDGLDANGSMYMTGGTVVVSGPTNDGNGALDYDGVFEVSGGFLVAAGSAGMAQAPSEESRQYSVIMNYSSVQQAGSIIHLQDSEGRTVLTYAPDKEYQSVVISSPELKKDKTYKLYSGGTSTGSVSDGLYQDGLYKDGTRVTDFTISKAVTWMSETGETSDRGFNNPGGGMGHGGGRGPEGGMGEEGGMGHEGMGRERPQDRSNN